MTRMMQLRIFKEQKYLSISPRNRNLRYYEHWSIAGVQRDEYLPSSPRPKMAEHILCRGNLFANWSTIAEGSSESEQVASHAQGRLRLVRKIVWLAGIFAMASRPFSDLPREYKLRCFSIFLFVILDNARRKISCSIEMRFRSQSI